MRVVLFDIDGTLVASLRAGVLAMDAALREEFGLSQPIDEAQISGQTDRAIATRQLERNGQQVTELVWERFLAAYLRHLPQLIHQHPGRVLPGIVPLLESLCRRSDLAIGLLTGNVPDGARIKLSHHGLDRYFAFGSFGDRHLTRNQVARQALDVIARHLPQPVHPPEVLVVGDTPLDVSCARSIGAQVVAVATGLHSFTALEACQPDLVLNDLSDPAPLLRLISAN